MALCAAGTAGKGTVAAISALHTILLTRSTQASPFAPAFLAAFTCIVAPEDDDGSDAPNDLILASMSVLLGRLLLVAPGMFASVVQRASSNLQLPDAHVHFCSRWLALADSIMLSSHRKLTCLGLVSFLSLDAAFLPLGPEILSYCVGQLAELNELAPPSGELPEVAVGVPLQASGEHAAFAKRLAESGIDSIPAMPLLPLLKERIAAAANVHGQRFHTMLASADVTVLNDVQRALGPIV